MIKCEEVELALLFRSGSDYFSGHARENVEGQFWKNFWICASDCTEVTVEVELDRGWKERQVMEVMKIFESTLSSQGI